ncbi:hypothetical protein K3495_g12205 [Podosphaera aphanis]|nr:hypothetical protein K3495_g12205 [Podosphaera aphanis]
MVRNKALVFLQTPTGYPIPGQDLAVVAGRFNMTKDPPPGGLTVKTLYASLDPYLRICMGDTCNGFFSPLKPIELGRPLASLSIAKVLKSSDQRFESGDLITGLLAIQEYSTIGKEWADYYAPIVNPYDLELPIFLATLGMTGITAIGSFYEYGRPEEFETIFISSAAGGVGQLVGQLSKELGLKVIGSVGTDEKLEFILTELEFDGGFNYKKENPLDALRRLAPEGIDIYHDNVGGEQLDAALEVIKEHGRIICCGMISDYNKNLEEMYGLKNLINVASKMLTVRGFLVADSIPDICSYLPDFPERVACGLSCGLLDSRHEVVCGIENGPNAFVQMLKGENLGKTILKIADNN